MERLSIATAIANESGSRRLLHEVHHYAIFIYELRRELEHVKERAEASLVLSTERGFINRRGLSEIYLGWAQAMMGDIDGGIATMRQHMLELAPVGSAFRKDYHLALIATALGRTGRFDEVLRTIDEAFPLIERSGQRMYEAEVHRLKGERLLARTRRTPRERSNPFAPRSTLRSTSTRSPGNCARRRASRGFSQSRVVATRRARRSPKSTAGSPRDSTHAI